MAIGLNILTDRERMVLSIIEEYMLEENVPPTVRVICEKCGYRSTSSAWHVIKQLEDKGFVRKTPDVSRCIVSKRIVYTESL